MTEHDFLLQAYHATAYVADESGEVATARIGQSSPGIDRLLRRRGAGQGCFITAWNPRSRRVLAAANRAAATRLAAAVGALGLSTLPHRGIPDDPGWPAEEGLFVLDIAPAAALGLAEAFGQNAFVRIALEAPAELVLTRWFPAG